MIPDGLQYFLDDFWNFQFCHQILTRAPRIYHKKTARNIRNVWKHVIEDPYAKLSHPQYSVYHPLSNV